MCNQTYFEYLAQQSWATADENRRHDRELAESVLALCEVAEAALKK